jgi:hypothetical protein
VSHGWVVAIGEPGVAATVGVAAGGDGDAAVAFGGMVGVRAIVAVARAEGVLLGAKVGVGLLSPPHAAANAIDVTIATAIVACLRICNLHRIAQETA